jgi:hypothetical protein
LKHLYTYTGTSGRNSFTWYLAIAISQKSMAIVTTVVMVHFFTVSGTLTVLVPGARHITFTVHALNIAGIPIPRPS